MTFIAIDTTGPRCAVLVHRAAKNAAENLGDTSGAGDVCLEEEIGRGHDARLASMAAEALKQAGVLAAALDRVVVATGPGSFTGVRVGVAFARGLALALDIPAVGVTGLDALAHTLGPRAHAHVVAVHDAKRGEVVWRAYRDGVGEGAPHRDPVATAAVAIDAWRAGNLVQLAGTGAGLLVGDGRMASEVERFAMWALADLGGAADPATARAAPFYHRPPDAKLPGGVDPFAADTL